MTVIRKTTTALTSREPFRLAYLTTGLSYGGAETQLKHIVIELKSRGWEIIIISMLPPIAYNRELADSGIEVISLNMRRGKLRAGALFEAGSILRRWRPHVVHSFMVHANILARLSRLIHWAPVQSSSARNTHEGGNLRMLAYRLTDPICDMTTQVSQAGVKRYVTIGAVPEGKIRMIPNGVETESFRPHPELRQRLRTELNIDDALVWLAVGRFEKQKDYPNLIRAFAKLATNRSNAILLVVGEGSLEREITSLVASLGLQERIRFLGVRRDMPAVMNAADAFVLASSWEGMPNTLLEASASELPIVATDVGGSREIVVDRQTGLLVPPHDSQALAEAMQNIMGLTAAERTRLGQAGRTFVDENFGLRSITSVWESLYSDLLEQKKGL